MMLEQVLLLFGALVFGALGSIHLVFTFIGSRFEPRHAGAMQAMKTTSPKISSETSMWSAWIGFNASHSLGAMIFSIIYLYLGVWHYEVVQHSIVLYTLPIIVGVAFLVLAKLYWFKIPLIGILIATLCFAGSGLVRLI